MTVVVALAARWWEEKTWYAVADAGRPVCMVVACRTAGTS